MFALCGLYVMSMCTYHPQSAIARNGCEESEKKRIWARIAYTIHKRVANNEECGTEQIEWMKGAMEKKNQNTTLNEECIRLCIFNGIVKIHAMPNQAPQHVPELMRTGGAEQRVRSSTGKHTLNLNMWCCYTQHKHIHNDVYFIPYVWSPFGSQILGFDQ